MALARDTFYFELKQFYNTHNARKLIDSLIANPYFTRKSISERRSWKMNFRHLLVETFGADGMTTFREIAKKLDRDDGSYFEDDVNWCLSKDEVSLFWWMLGEKGEDVRDDTPWVVDDEDSEESEDSDE